MGNRRISTTLLISICIIATFFLGYTEILVIRPNGNDKETLLEIKALVEKQNKEILELKAQLANPSSLSSSSSSSSSSSASELKPANHAISTPPTTSPTSTPVTRDLHPVLDFEDLPYLVGPRNGDINTSRTLVTICIGKSDKAMINKLITTYFQPYNLSAPHPESPFTFLLFHYDNADYSEFPWYNQLNVVAIRVLHKMKYWYLKRFLTPDIARSFQNIIILDGDVDFEAPFDPLQYLRVANAFNISMSQPAHFQATTSLHNGIKVKEGSQIGRYRDFIECGPAVFLSSAAYQCIWELLQPDLTSGWGLDVIWVDYLRSVCGYSDKSVAIFDAFVLIHETPSSQGTASSNPGFNSKAINELTAYNARFPQLKQSWGSLVQEGAPFGDKKCLKSEDPVKCS